MTARRVTARRVTARAWRIVVRWSSSWKLATEMELLPASVSIMDHYSTFIRFLHTIVGQISDDVLTKSLMEGQLMSTLVQLLHEHDSWGLVEKRGLLLAKDTVSDSMNNLRLQTLLIIYVIFSGCRRYLRCQVWHYSLLLTHVYHRENTQKVNSSQDCTTISLPLFNVSTHHHMKNKIS